MGMCSRLLSASQKGLKSNMNSQRAKTVFLLSQAICTLSVVMNEFLF